MQQQQQQQPPSQYDTFETLDPAGPKVPLATGPNAHAYDDFAVEENGVGGIGGVAHAYDEFGDVEYKSVRYGSVVDGYEAMRMGPYQSHSQNVSHGPAENVYFSAFAPLSVARSELFDVAISAYLRQQREEVLERAREAHTVEKGIPNLLKLFRSSWVTVSLHLGSNFEISEPVSYGRH